MPVGDDPHLVSLLATSQGSRDPDHRLAALHAPILKFDAREPFLPKAVGYTIFRESADSPSYPRRVELTPDAHPPVSMAIEYAIWWDWDITHLYELEHVWVFVDPGGRVVGIEASWHGDHRTMAVDGSVPMMDGRPSLYSEPGKHALEPVADGFYDRAEATRQLCSQWAGTGGVLVAPLYEGVITAKTPRADRLVRAYLEGHAFEPSFDFSLSFSVDDEALVPWPVLDKWIPERVSWLVDQLERAEAARKGLGPPDAPETSSQGAKVVGR